MLLHLTSNIVAGGILFPIFAGFDQTRYYALFIAGAWLVAFVILWSTRLSLGRR